VFIGRAGNPARNSPAQKPDFCRSVLLHGCEVGMKGSLYQRICFSSLLSAAVAMLLAVLASTAQTGPVLVIWMVAGLAVAGAAAGISWFFSAAIAWELRQLSGWLTVFVRGDDDLPDPPATSLRECMKPWRDFQRLAAWQREMLEVCWAAREGNPARRLEVRGDRDQLAVAFNGMLDDLHQANTQYAEAISYLHALPTPVQVVDRNLTIRFINRAGARSARLAVGQCIGRKCHELFRTRDCNSERCKVARAMVQDRSLTGENVIITPKGEAPYRYTAAPLKDENGQIIGAVEYIVDIRDEMKVVELAEAVSQGNYEITIPPRSEEDRLSHALNRMAFTLRELAGSQEAERWLASGAEAVSDRLHGEHDLLTLSHNILEVLVEVIDAQVAVFYLAQGHGNLQLLKAYGADEKIAARQVIGRDQGIIGRALHHGKALVVNDLPPDYLRISSGLGEARAAGVLVAPIYFENRLLAVIELGRHQPFTQREGLLLDRVLENIGVAIQTTEARVELARLLATTQEQSEKLQVQQEELQQTNEELQEQARALSVSEERLQTQQEELRVSNEELAERSKVLLEKNEEVEAANLKLDQARRDLEEKACALEVSGRYKSEFLANMSHELRTPLNSILILSQLLAGNKEKNLLPKQVDFASTIHNSGSDLLNLINEVLDLSKIEAGRMEINPEEVVLENLLSSLLAPFKPLAEQKHLQLELVREKNAPAVIFTDDVRLRQVLNNLLSNAFKFTERGTIGLTVGRPAAGTLPPALAAAGPKQTLYFRVRDSGIGIPRDKLEIVFEAFKQADGTTSRQFGGTGLGLSISRELARLLGGALTVESKVGKGSAFTLWLPERLSAIRPSPPTRNISASAKTDAPAALETSTTETSAADPHEQLKLEPGTGKLIPDDRRNIKNGDKVLLMVEDDPVFASLLLDLAREKGYQGLIAEDGETGLHLADYHRPSAILLDMGLPGISGREVLKRLKNNPETRHIPVHFISASDQSAEIMQMGAIGYLTKPVSVEKLDQVFTRIEKLVATPIKRLLIVEDDLVQRQAIKALIGNGDVTVVEAAGGEEAHRLLKADHFDCVILDLGLEDMSGFDLLARIKEDREISRTPVVIYTGREIGQEEEERLQQYADSIIIKGARSPERLLDETTLFLHRVEKNLPKDQQEILNTLHNRESTFSGRTILVVDDDMRNVFALSSVLEEQGLEILVARNGLEALEKLTAHPKTSLVLMDIMMPEMDGYEAMRRIRNDPNQRHLPIIALTAKAMRGDKDKCLAAGANDYLAKPVDPEKLVSLLRVWLYR
jgi:CheY-like chemotaxis protein/PAS domain-containing protein